MAESAASIDYDDVMERGFDALRRNNPREALRLGELLEGHRYSGGFELQGLALGDMGKRKAAIALLERAVATVPKVWVLWQLLGSYYSYEGRFEDAFGAFERALECGGDEGSVQYNYANALRRSGNSANAKARLAPLLNEPALSEDPYLGRLIIEMYEEMLLEERCLDEAEALVERFSGVIAKASMAPAPDNLLK